MDGEVAHLKRLGITLVLDVGANVGQTGHKLRREGYAGRIVSFEPIAEPFARLAAAAAADPLWECSRVAIGDRAESRDIGVSGNVVSSSLREPVPEAVDIVGAIAFSRRERIAVRPLAEALAEHARPDDRIHLKLDVQGWERDILHGAGPLLDRFESVRIESSISPVYEGEMLVPEAIALLDAAGFVLIEAAPGWRHPRTGEALQLDLMFRRRAA